MPYKRFTYIPFDGFMDLDKELDAYEVLNLLNELHEENQSLKKQNKRLHDDLHKVNEITRGY